MPHVIDDTDVQEYSSPPSEYDALYERSRVVPASRRGHFALWAVLHRMLIPLLRLRPTRRRGMPHPDIEGAGDVDGYCGPEISRYLSADHVVVVLGVSSRLGV